MTFIEQGLSMFGIRRRLPEMKMPANEMTGRPQALNLNDLPRRHPNNFNPRVPRLIPLRSTGRLTNTIPDTNRQLLGKPEPDPTQPARLSSWFVP